MFHFVQIMAQLPIRILYPTKFHNKKNMPKGPCIIACNHTSNLDAVILAVHTWEKKYYLSKKELFKNKCFGGFLKLMGAVKIDRQGTDITAIKQSLKVLKSGKKLVVYPEGTRTNNENMELGEIKQGVSMFAIKGKVPIVPMFISRKPKIFKKVHVFVGEPFTLEDYYGKKLDSEELEKASEFVAKKMNDLHDKAMNSLTKKK